MEGPGISIIAELGGQGGDRSLRKEQGGHGPVEEAFAALEPSPNFSKREEDSTWACFTLAGAPESALLPLLGLPGHASQAGHLSHPKSAVCLALNDAHPLCQVCSGPSAPGPPAASAALMRWGAQTAADSALSCVLGSSGKLWTYPLGPCLPLSHPVSAQSMASPWSSGSLFRTQVFRSEKGAIILNIFSLYFGVLCVVSIHFSLMKGSRVVGAEAVILSNTCECSAKHLHVN